MNAIKYIFISNQTGKIIGERIRVTSHSYVNDEGIEIDCVNEIMWDENNPLPCNVL